MNRKEFNSKNLIHGDNRHYYIPIVVSFLFIYLAPFFKEFDLALEAGLIGATGWLLFHLLRFRKKESPSWMDKLKLAIAFFLGLSLIELYLNNGFKGVFFLVSIFSVFTIYFIDRIILNNMKKLSIALIIVLMLVSVFFVVYANIQTELAKEKALVAEQLASDALDLVEAAEKEAAKARELETELVLLKQKFQECQESNNP